MTKQSPSSQKKINAAKKAATLLVSQRKKLRQLLNRLEVRGHLSAEEQSAATNLIAQIEKSKATLEQLGFDPNQAASWVKSTELATHKKRKGKAPKRPKRKSGIGMYGLGNSLKVWR